MKRLLLVLLPISLFLSIGFSQQEYNMNDLVEMDNGLWTEKFSDEPITGKVYHSTGKIYGETTFKDGKQDGLSTRWYEDGQKEKEGTYKDGIRDGLMILWYENGQKKREINFKDDERTSEKWWNEDGSVKE
jgi:antitoxin component YwqK of YwqJK toxin-antitoxin module